MKHQLRWRRVVAASAVMVTSAGLASAVGGTVAATAAADPGDCATAFPTEELVDGDAVTGLTVSEGTTPEPFTGEFLGTIQDGIAVGLDMVMVRLSSPEIDRVGGIWQGMSGSPVYAEDGRLIGAVAYGLAWGTTPVAGVTPFDAMDDYVAAPAARVKVGRRAARKIAQDSEVTREQAESGFRQLRMPTSVSGLTPKRLDQATGRKWLPKQTQQVGSTGTGGASPGAEAIVAGGNLAAAFSYGDITMGGVGTATSVCDGDVVGFGHPMSFSGKTTATLHPADALYIQEDPVGVPFKVANFAPPVGTIDQDRLAAISGTLGPLPATSSVTSTVASASRQRTGDTQVSVPDFMPSAVFYQLLANQDRIFDRIGPGSAEQAWTIAGRRADGSPFTLELSDRFSSQWDISFEMAWDVPDQVWFLSSFQGVTIDDVTVSSTMTDDPAAWRIRRLEQMRGGVWHTVNRRNPAFGRAGRALRLRATLAGADGVTRTVRMKRMIPKRARSSFGVLQVTGGASQWASWSGKTVDDALAGLAGQIRNDEIEMQLFLERQRRSWERTSTAGPLDGIVRGGRSVEVWIR